MQRYERILQKYWSSQTIRVVNAENGKEGIEKALAEKPDIIVCDIMMPVLDGYGVLHMLK